MLRQIFFIKNGNIIFQYNFARAYNSDDLSIVISKLKDFIDQSMPNQFFHRPLLNFQIIYGKISDIFYLFVCDVVDRYNYVEKEIKKLSKIIIELGNNIDNVIKNNNIELENIIQTIHYELHPKISIVGAINSGRTTLINMLKINDREPKNIMSFAKVYKSKISDLFFDIWDFVEEEDFSPLWGNFIRGSDLIILIFNSTQIIENKIRHFINLCKKEGKFSKMMILLSHSNSEDAIKIDIFKEKFGELIDSNIYKYDILEADIADILQEYIIDVLIMKKQLPDTFRQLLIESNQAIKSNNYPKAIQNLKQLINIADKYQEIEYLKTFTNKINELEQKWEKQKREQKIEKKRIIAPKKIKFSNKITVKTLKLPSVWEKSAKPDNPKMPENKSLTIQHKPPLRKKGIKNNLLTFERSPLVKNEIIRKVKDYGIQAITPKEKENIDKKFKKIELNAKNEKKENLYGLFSQSKKIKKEAKQEKDSTINQKEKEERIIYEQDLLFKTIKGFGGSLSKDLCSKFILQMRNKLKKKQLSESYIISAAKLYTKKVK